jgi:hypothetical protein
MSTIKIKVAAGVVMTSMVFLVSYVTHLPLAWYTFPTSVVSAVMFVGGLFTLIA